MPLLTGFCRDRSEAACTSVCLVSSQDYSWASIYALMTRHGAIFWSRVQQWTISGGQSRLPGAGIAKHKILTQHL